MMNLKNKYYEFLCEFFVILGHFLLFQAPNNPENQKFEKLKQLLGDIIILHTCTINDDHMMYGS